MNILGVVSTAVAVTLGGLVFGLLCRRLANRGRPPARATIVVVLVGLLVALGGKLLLDWLFDTWSSS